MKKARHLHLVAPERTYVVARTRLVVPGRPYVVAECAGGAVASAPDGLEMIARSTMLRQPSLREALEAWEAQDDGLMRRDEGAGDRLSRGVRSVSPAERAARAAHPSTIAKHPFAPHSPPAS
jgi:hypothetical protein